MRTQQPSMYSTEVCSVLSALDKLCIGGHWVPLCHSIAVIGSKILVGWDSNSPHIMIVQPRTYIYIYTHTHPAWQQKPHDESWFSQNLPLYHYGATQAREAPMFLLTKFESSTLLAAFLSHDGPAHKFRCLGWESICHAADSADFCFIANEACLKSKTYGPMFEQGRQKVWNLQFARSWVCFFLVMLILLVMKAKIHIRNTSSKRQLSNLPTPFAHYLDPLRVGNSDWTAISASWAPQRRYDSCHKWSDVVVRREPH